MHVSVSGVAGSSSHHRSTGPHMAFTCRSTRSAGQCLCICLATRSGALGRMIRSLRTEGTTFSKPAGRELITHFAVHVVQLPFGYVSLEVKGDRLSEATF